MKKILLLLMSAQLNFACEHTIAIQDFLHKKIDAIMMKNDVVLVSKEDLTKVRVYLEILDYVSAID